VSSPDKFRAFALVCMRRATESREQRAQEILFSLAAHWMRAARQAERSSVVRIDDQSPLVPEDA
jgi:hypothetical protein